MSERLGPKDAGGPAPKQPGPFTYPGLLRAPATLDQMKMTRSPELGRSPFWERSSRALPDPEMLPRRVRRVGPRIVPAVKSPAGCAKSGRSTLELRTCFELPATHGWAAQLYLHPTTDRLGSPAAPPSTATGDPLITAAAIGRYRGLSLCRSVCAVTVAGDGAYRETPTTPQRPRWRRHPRPKPPPSLPLLCPERKHSASSQALSTIGGLSGFSRLILRLRG